MTDDRRTRDFVDNELGNLPIGAADDPLNFVDEVIAYLERWAAAWPIPIALQSPAYCCFVKCDRVVQVGGSAHGFSLQRYFRLDTPQDLPGRLYLCASTLQTVYSKGIAISNLGHAEDEVKRLSVEAEVVVIFNAASKRAFWRTRATSDLVPIDIGTDTNDLLRSEDFDEELKRFHIECTATPDGHVHPWKNARKLLTREFLEVGIRDCLSLFLKYKHKKSLKVFRESFETTGRADLKVYFRIEDCMFFLELKVLRAVKPSGKGIKSIPAPEIINWGKEGIIQAHSYRLANDETGVAYACCYDARGTDVEIPELEDYARSLSVEYRRYFIYQSSEDFRHARS